VADPAARDAFLADLRDALKSMETLGTSDIIVLSGDVVPGLARETQHQSCVETLKRAAAMVEGKQIDGRPVRIQFETIDPLENPKYYLTSMIENFEVVRAVNHPQVRALYDFFHEQIAEGNLIAKLEKNMDILGLVHVADVPGRHHPGSGEINYGNIFRKLAELNYQHTIAMEFVPLGDGVAELRKAKELALSAGAV
jgi:hydroxypyruvate isomerase